jgi:hypothetical protein
MDNVQRSKTLETEPERRVRWLTRTRRRDDYLHAAQTCEAAAAQAEALARRSSRKVKSRRCRHTRGIVWFPFV